MSPTEVTEVTEHKIMTHFRLSYQVQDVNSQFAAVDLNGFYTTSVNKQRYQELLNGCLRTLGVLVGDKVGSATITEIGIDWEYYGACTFLEDN
jgi:hypothetical protein